MTKPVVTVRMYRDRPRTDESGKASPQGLLGDCFLVRFEAEGVAHHLLIDFGALHGTPHRTDRMREIAEDIRRTCNGTLDLVVATHEHVDHLAGFAAARDAFAWKASANEATEPEAKRPRQKTKAHSKNDDPGAQAKPITIRNVWLAWTEDPEDKQASVLRARFQRHRAIVNKIAEDMRATADQSGQPDAGVIEGLEAFIGDPTELGAAGRMTTGDVLAALKSCDADVRYLEPGNVLKLPFEPALRVFVLGPPRNEQLLFKDLPSAGDSRETYLAADLPEPAAHAPRKGGGAHDADRQSALQKAQDSPFALPWRQLLACKDTVEEMDEFQRYATAREWLERHYFQPTLCQYDGHPPEKHDCAHDPVCGEIRSRRRIDGRRLDAASRFALKLDSDTNNTSLVLAIELPDKTFLLFAGDAQVGNWESWHCQDYDSGNGRKLTADDILERTRLYKVGHHGSHNATLRQQGLEKMTRDDLVAMVSTDEIFASRQGTKGWLMPDPDLKPVLLDRTQGRLIRGDRKWATDPDVAGYGKSRDFIKRLKDGDERKGEFHVEYRIYG